MLKHVQSMVPWNNLIFNPTTWYLNNAILGGSSYIKWKDFFSIYQVFLKNVLTNASYFHLPEV